MLAISFGCVSTRKDSADIAIQQAGANAPEIRKVLKHYDDARNDAAEYLVKTMIGRYGISGDGLDSIENLFKELPVNGVWNFDSVRLARGKMFESMPRHRINDLETVSAEYLIRNIDDAWRMKEARNWNKDLGLEQFCELLLPYRSGDEALSDWRQTNLSHLRITGLPINGMWFTTISTESTVPSTTIGSLPPATAFTTISAARGRFTVIHPPLTLTVLISSRGLTILPLNF